MFFNVFDALGFVPTAIVASLRALGDTFSGPKSATETPDDGNRGVLIECDTRVKQFLLALNDQKPLSEKFIVESFGDALLVKISSVDELQERIRQFQSQRGSQRELAT